MCSLCHFHKARLLKTLHESLCLQLNCQLRSHYSQLHLYTAGWILLCFGFPQRTQNSSYHSRVFSVTVILPNMFFFQQNTDRCLSLISFSCSETFPVWWCVLDVCDHNALGVCVSEMQFETLYTVWISSEWAALVMYVKRVSGVWLVALQLGQLSTRQTRMTSTFFFKYRFLFERCVHDSVCAVRLVWSAGGDVVMLWSYSTSVDVTWSTLVRWNLLWIAVGVRSAARRAVFDARVRESLRLRSSSAAAGLVCRHSWFLCCVVPPAQGQTNKSTISPALLISMWIPQTAGALLHPECNWAVCVLHSEIRFVCRVLVLYIVILCDSFAL